MSAAPIRVLVVDDEPPIRKLLRMGLTAHGYQILEAPNAKIALDLLAESPIWLFSISACLTRTATSS